jgi:hypothetical protein
MGNRKVIQGYQIVTGGDASLATVTSPVINIQNLDNVGFQINITTGTPAGTFAVQVSMDYKEYGTFPNAQVLVAGTWTTLTSQVIASGTPTPITFDLNQLSSPWIRLLYTKTSGTGNFDVFICGKSLS